MGAACVGVGVGYLSGGLVSSRGSGLLDFILEGWMRLLYRVEEWYEVGVEEWGGVHSYIP